MQNVKLKPLERMFWTQLILALSGSLHFHTGEVISDFQLDYSISKHPSMCLALLMVVMRNLS